MKIFFTLLRKEAVFQLRTYRALVVAAVFFFFGLGTPLLLKYLPEIMKLSGEQPGLISLPEFTSVDVVRSYVNSFSQIGMVVVVLVSMGAVGGEAGSGTAAMVLSKPVGRGRFIGAKLVALATVFAAGLLLAALGAYAYTSILFGGLGAAGFAATNLLLGLYLLVAAALTVMFSSFFRSPVAAGACGIASAIAFSVTSGLPWVGRYMPGMLLGWATTAGSANPSTAWGALAVSAGFVVLATVAGWQVFRRKEL